MSITSTSHSVWFPLWKYSVIQSLPGWFQSCHLVCAWLSSGSSCLFLGKIDWFISEQLCLFVCFYILAPFSLQWKENIILGVFLVWNFPRPLGSRPCSQQLWIFGPLSIPSSGRPLQLLTYINSLCSELFEYCFMLSTTLGTSRGLIRLVEWINEYTKSIFPLTSLDLIPHSSARWLLKYSKTIIRIIPAFVWVWSQQETNHTHRQGSWGQHVKSIYRNVGRAKRILGAPQS